MRFDFDLDAIESYVANHLRFFISLALGLIVFVGIIALTVFFIAVRGAEQTMVPDVRGKDLTEALLELQVKELYPRIQLRYSQSAYDKGLILEQNPNGGTIVKAGRRVRLVVSQGVVINTVENYTGRNIDEVRMDLRTLFASAGNVSSQPLLSLKEPIMYQFSNEPAGTILQQSPEPGTQISGPMVLEFVVSRGLENAITKVPALVGLSVSAALEEINKAGMSFIFSLRPARNNEKAEMVVYQDPPAQSPVAVNTAVSVMVSAPLQVDEGEVFGLFNYTLQENPYPLPVSLEALLPSGERRLLAAVDHPGGAFTFPYRLPRGTTLILSMLNREIYREEIYPSPDELSLDQL